MPVAEQGASSRIASTGSRRLPFHHVGDDDLGGEAGAGEIVGKSRETTFRDVERGDLPAGGGELHGLAARARRRGRAPCGPRPDRAGGREARRRCPAPTSGPRHSPAGRRRRCRAGARRWPGIRLTPSRSGGDFRRRKDEVERRRRGDQPGGGGDDVVAPGLVPALRDRGRQGRDFGQGPALAHHRRRTRRGRAGADRRRPAAARSRSRHGAACRAPAPGPARCAARSAPWHRRAGASSSRGRSGRRDRGGGAAPRRRWHGRSARSSGWSSSRAARVERGLERQALAQHRVEQAQGGAACRQRRVGPAVSAPPPERIERAGRGRRRRDRRPAAASGGRARRPSPRARRSGSRSPDGSRTGCRRGRGPERCRARRRPGLRAATGLGIRAAPSASLASAEASARGLPADLGAAAVGAIFAGAADRELDDHRRERRDDHRQQHGEQVAAAVAAAEEEAEIGEHRDRAGDGRGHRHDQRVAILHVRQLVRHHRRDLVAGRGCRSRPVVAATAAFSGLRPVAKALGWGESIR